MLRQAQPDMYADINVTARSPEPAALQPMHRYRVVHVCETEGDGGEYESLLRVLAEELTRSGDAIRVLFARAELGKLQSFSAIDFNGTNSIFDARTMLPATVGLHPILRQIEDADIVHVHGTSAAFHYFARTKRIHRKPLVANFYARGCEQGRRSSLWHAMQKMRIIASMVQYGYINCEYPSVGKQSLLRRKSGVGPSLSETISTADKPRLRDIYGTVTGREYRSIIGLRISMLDGGKAIALLDRSVSERSRMKLAFVNANLAYKSARDANVLDALKDFTLLNDGLGIDIASRLLYGSKFPQNLNGTDFVPEYLDKSVHRLRIFLLGARSHVVARAGAKFEERWPMHEIVGYQHGYFEEAEALTIANRIAALAPDIVLVGMGNPRQELWAAEFVPIVAPVAICVGALFDFIAGEVNRAPRWVRALRAEWAYRMLQEPHRLWRRYTVESFLFLSGLCRQYLSGARA